MTDRATLLARAKEMRANPTEPEIRLWRALSNSRLGGFKFRRQAVFANRIFDFFCPQKLLAVEVDGDTHDRETDLARDESLQVETGVRTVRYTNDEVMQDRDGVLDDLLKNLNAAPDRWTAHD